MSNLLGDYVDQKLSSFDIDLELDPYKNRKHWAEVKAATGESKRFEKTIENVPPPKAFRRRKLRQLVPEDVKQWAESSFSINVSKGASF